MKDLDNERERMTDRRNTVQDKDRQKDKQRYGSLHSQVMVNTGVLYRQ